jgi:triacylglycerol esterase/lipase EstA (alpha/beta hydrolase family)
MILAVASLAPASQRVYLLHGFGSSPIAMAKIARAIEKKGLPTTNYGYNSLYRDLDSLGSGLRREIASIPEDTVSFVTHSMGALVVRSMCRFLDSTARFPVIHRIVMIAPPNRGAQIADFFSSNPVIAKALGPNLVKMRTDSCSYANSLPKPRFGEIGIIVGMQKGKLWFNRTAGGVNDGFLTPEKTTLGVEKEIAVVKSTHILITVNRETVDLTIRFLLTGSFKE